MNADTNASEMINELIWRIVQIVVFNYEQAAFVHLFE